MNASSPTSSRKSAIVFALDEKFAPLGKGLVLSLRGLGLPDESADLCLIDIGCGQETQNWMTGQGCVITRFDDSLHSDSLISVPPPRGGGNYMKAQVCRPFIPQILPGYFCYLYLDSDVWVQKRESLEIALSAARDSPDRVALAPFVDFSYAFNYAPVEEENYLRFLGYFYDWYSASYGSAVAERWKGRALFSSGVFAMAAECPLWKAWAAELGKVYARDYANNPVAFHLSEQTALNHLIYSTGGYIPLEAIHNYHCHVGAVERDLGSGEVVIKYPPRRPVGIVHLSYASKMMPSYLERGLLWDQGKYLSEKEIAELKQTRHY
jgi:hypothetical protein